MVSDVHSLKDSGKLTELKKKSPKADQWIINLRNLLLLKNILSKAQ